MRSRAVQLSLLLGLCLVLTASVAAAEVSGLKRGTPQLQSAGPLAFGPEGILLVGDPLAASVFAIDTRDATGNAADASLNVDNVQAKVATLLNASASNVQINDLAVNPISGNVYLSVSQAGAPALVRISGDGKLSQVELKDVAFSVAELADAPENKVVGEGRRQRNPRSESITDLAFVDGQILVSGLSNAQAASSVRSLSFPPSNADKGTSLEIYHGAHGKSEDYAAIRTFVPFAIGGEAHLLAAYTCTPLVKFPVNSLAPGEKVQGTTVAELGNRNRPLDMIVYQKDGKNFLLLANSSRGVMKISTENIADREAITSRVEGGGIAGQPYETVKQMDGVVQLDRLNETHAVVLQQTEAGQLNLRTVPLP